MSTNNLELEQTLFSKRILVGVTGGIAAYKSAEIVRRLQDYGAEVRVVMTPAAQEFITPLTLQALSGNPVHTSLLDPEAEAAMGHIELARWADMILVAPASADFLAKLCHGEGSDLLSTLCLANSSNIAVAPAMNQAMWAAKSTQSNLTTLKQRGIHIFGPASGVQACGDVGYGRMLEPNDIASACAASFTSGLLSGKTVVITAGPTREAIDPVRYISNHSSGKMGYALASACIEAGAKTILISGPVNLKCPDRVRCISVVSAEDMYSATMDQVSQADIFIATAAVADFKPTSVNNQKIKKGEEDTMTLELVKNPDIVAGVASLQEKPYVIGFAAETQNVEIYARQKLRNKNLDMIIANDVSDSSVGFNSDENKVQVFTEYSEHAFEQMSKSSLSRKLVRYFSQDYAKYIGAHQSNPITEP